MKIKYYFVCVSIKGLGSTGISLENFLSFDAHPLKVPKILSDDFKCMDAYMSANHYKFKVVSWQEITEEEYKKYEGAYPSIEPMSSVSMSPSERVSESSCVTGYKVKNWG